MEFNKRKYMGFSWRQSKCASNPFIRENVHMGFYLFILCEGQIDAGENDEWNEGSNYGWRKKEEFAIWDSTDSE